MMEDSALSRWIYLGVLTVFVGGAMKHLSGAPGDLVEPLWTSVLPVLSVLSILPVLLLLLLLLLLLRLAASSLCSPGLLPAGGKAVLITGCDSGFGKATVQRLDSLGFQVFATVLDLNGDGARELRRSCSSLLTLLQVDITQPQEVQQALLDTQAKLGHRGLWGLVNNAGVCVNFGDVELSLMKNFRGCMEVNFFGTLNVTKSFLPLLRLTRGRIVTVSSPAGDQPFPCLSAYGASKAALNLLTDTLRHELEPWGVRVSTVLPSSYRTGRCSDREHWERQHKELLQGLAPALLEDYGEDYVTETKDLFHSYAARANTDLSPVVDAIVQALLAPRPRTHYYAGPGVGLMYFVHSYCPPHVSSHFLKKLFVRKTLKPRALRMVAGSDQDLGLDMSLHHHNNNNNNNNNDDNKKLQ